MYIAERHGVRTKQKRALRQRAAGFVHTDCRHICTRIHRGDRKAVTEVQMCAVRFIHEHLHAVGMCELRNRAKVGADSIIRRIVDKDRLCIRMTRNCCGDILYTHPECNAESVVDPGIYIDWNCTAENERVDRAPMNIARHDNLVAAPHCREHHCLYRARRPTHHEECVCGAECLRCKTLRISNHGNGMTEVVEHLHRVDIDIQTRAA